MPDEAMGVPDERYVEGTPLTKEQMENLENSISEGDELNPDEDEEAWIEPADGDDDDTDL